MAALFKVTDNFEARLRVMFQDSMDHGFPATFAPLPEFTPVYTIDRAFDVQPRAIRRLGLALARPQVFRHGLVLVVLEQLFLSPYAGHRGLDLRHAASVQRLLRRHRLAGTTVLWDGERFHNQLTEELRLSFDPIHDVSGTVGAYYSRTHNKFEHSADICERAGAATADNTVVGPWPNDLIWTDSIPTTQQDESVFARDLLQVLRAIQSDLGRPAILAQQHTDYTANGFMNFGPTLSAPTHNSESGFDPKVGLSYQARKP